MVYLVTKVRELFDSEFYTIIDESTACSLLNGCSVLQFDSETSGIDCRVDTLLSIQLGSKEKDFQLVIDCTTIDINVFKPYLEKCLLVGHNLKFDLQWLYNYGIVPRKVYDTMIVEQVLYLGFPYVVITPEEYKEYNYTFPYKEFYKMGESYYSLSFSLQALAKKYLDVELDKTVRGEIIWSGLSERVILYAAKDVEHLEDIMKKQIKDCGDKDCMLAAKLECDFVSVIAYLEWCGIRLDIEKWQDKMKKDLEDLEDAKKALDNFVVNTPKLSKFTYVERQGSLFDGFDLTPRVTINWSSSAQVVQIAKILGFNTVVQDKETGEDKDSVIEKHLKKQKGINDEFLRLYLGKGRPGDKDYYIGYQGASKLVSSFGQGHLDSINPITGRIHTQYKQLGADTGRMSCGSKEPNVSLSKYKGLPKGRCKYPNMQQLPHDKLTRSCFTASKGNLWVSCDYAAIESRLGADIYEEEAMINEFLYGSGDMHSLVAKMIFDELKDVPIKEIKEKYPHLRNAAKPVEFSQQFGGSAFAIQNSMGCSLEEAQAFADAYSNGFKGITKFKTKGSAFVRDKGYIVLCPVTGHKTYWWDHQVWKKKQSSFTPGFWEDYRLNHKGTGDSVSNLVSTHFKAASKWDRKALNSVTQGTGAIILKDSQVAVFNWIVDNGYFNKILLCNLTHDEANWEFPEELKDTFPELLRVKMEESGSKYCKSLPIPAEYSVGNYWIH